MFICFVFLASVYTGINRSGGIVFFREDFVVYLEIFRVVCFKSVWEF